MTRHAHILTGTEISTGRRKPSELVAEYCAKLEEIPTALAAFEAAQRTVETASTIGGAYPGMRIDKGCISATDMQRALLRSAWRHTYDTYGLSQIATATDKKRIARMFEDPPEFTIDAIREHFGAYVADPWGSILRGLAEVFADLDPAYKSHEKVMIGAKGLPKRVILTGFGTRWGRGADQCRDILNALAAYQGKPLITHLELSALEKDGDCLRDGGTIPDPFQSRSERTHDPKVVKVIGRGVWLKRFQNGNRHLFFGPEALRDINRALAEFYGDVLADCPEERPAKRTSTDVSKDLQYYPTPRAVVDRVLAEAYSFTGKRVLEPSCGCGRFLDALRKAGAQPFGIEVDAGRAAACRSRGHNVLTSNFLQHPPSPEFDFVVMNPPFYGRHYAKHVRHALRFLKPGGTLYAILPATARYDHGELDDLRPVWRDLPVASFADSGTNIATTIATIRRAA